MTKNQRQLAIYREEMTKSHPCILYRKRLYSKYVWLLNVKHWKYPKQLEEMLEQNNRWINRAHTK